MAGSYDPIVLIEDDLDDQELIRDMLKELEIKNELRVFSTAAKGLEYLLTTDEKPFLIISDVNLPGMSGIEMRENINHNEYLRSKSVPFVFLSTASTDHAVNQAYNMMVQGFFSKPDNLHDLKKILKLIVDYWSICKHPNN